MRKIALLFVVLVSIFALTGCGGRNSDFGYVDMQRIATESTSLAEMNQEIASKISEFQALDEKEQTELGEEDFAKNRQMRQSELSTLQRDLEAKFMANINEAMDEVCREKNLSAVLVKNSVLSGGIDVTEEVLNRIK